MLQPANVIIPNVIIIELQVNIIVINIVAMSLDALIRQDCGQVIVIVIIVHIQIVAHLNMVPLVVIIVKDTILKTIKIIYRKEVIICLN